MGQVFVNNGRARLQGAINSTQTTIKIEQAYNLPTSLAAGEWFLLTIAHQDSRYGSNIEVVRVTAVASDPGGFALTVERGYEGAAVAHASTDVVEARTTADTHQRMLDGAEWGSVLNKPAEATRWPDWNEVTSKPGAFTPVAHTHPWNEVTGKPAEATRWPAWAEVTGKPTNFPPSTHGHAWSQIASKPSTATRWPSYSEVTDKPNTTDSRGNVSTSTLLQAKAMSDHTSSSDHDGRYFSKNETDTRYLSKTDGGTLSNDLTISRSGTVTSGLHLEGGRTGIGGSISTVEMTNLLNNKTGSLETWTDVMGVEHNLEIRGFDKTKIATAVEISNTTTLSSDEYVYLNFDTARPSGNIGGIHFHRNGVREGVLNFGSGGKVEAIEGAYFSGNGEGLINLPASAISSGTVAINRLPSTSSRNTQSSDLLLTAKAMDDHVGSDDHDGRYHTKTIADGRFVHQTGYSAFNPSGDYTGLRARSTTKDDVGLGNVQNLDQRDASNITSGNPMLSSQIGFHADANVIIHNDSNSASGAGWSGKDSLTFKGDGNTDKMAVYAGHFHSIGASEFQGKVTVGSVITAGTVDDGLNKVQVTGGVRTDTLAAGGVESPTESIDTDGNIRVRDGGHLKMGGFSLMYNPDTQSLDFNMLGG